MTSPKQEDYVLQGGDRGAERLRLLSSVKWPTTRSLLDKAGLSPGMYCLDVGCGIGAVTLKIAQAVGPLGRVTGIDFDESCLKAARLEAQRLELDVEFRAISANDLQDSSIYDFIFARFLLTHLSDPEKALERMSQAARPGGTVVVEDIQFTGHFSCPGCPAFDRYVTWYQDVVRHKGGDPNIGPRLLGLFLDAGFIDVEIEVIQPSFRQGPGKQIAAVTMENIREAVVTAGLASNQEIDEVIEEIASFAKDSRTILSLPRIFQIWGRRPH